MSKNLIITGIGGQGTVTAAGLLRWAILAAGNKLTGQDNRGGAQRLGHVSAIIRSTPDHALSLAPDIPQSACDLLISLEGSEGLRFWRELGPRTVVVYSPRLVIPTNERRAKKAYISLETLRHEYRQRSGTVLELDGEELAARHFRQPVLGNLMMLGAGLVLLDWPDVDELLAGQLAGDSLKAYDMGRTISREHNA
jgi:indolepyruvate ferredoxin oxidoreductase beta subunit